LVFEQLILPIQLQSGHKYVLEVQKKNVIQCHSITVFYSSETVGLNYYFEIETFFLKYNIIICTKLISNKNYQLMSKEYTYNFITITCIYNFKIINYI